MDQYKQLVTSHEHSNERDSEHKKGEELSLHSRFCANALNAHPRLVVVQTSWLRQSVLNEKQKRGGRSELHKATRERFAEQSTGPCRLKSEQRLAKEKKREVLTFFASCFLSPTSIEGHGSRAAV